MSITAVGTYEELCRLARQTGTLESVSHLVSWDQETYMPPGAIAGRAEQKALLAGMIHERVTSMQMGDLISECEADPDLMSDPASASARNIVQFRRDYDLATKLPKELVEELASVGAQSQEVWKEACPKSDFAMFLPWLEKMMALSLAKAECYGWADDGEAYDALINEYEPATTAKQIEAVFTPLGKRLAAFLQELGQGTPPSDAPLNTQFAAANQHEFGQFIIKNLGFDLNAGRLDTTTHPFCEGLAPGDTRLTTRYREERFTDALYGTMHEAGHGMYEQGLPKADLFGQPLAQAVSLGIHESQSRMWENSVGRSKAFWTWALPHAKKILGPAMEQYSVDDMYRAVNTASPSFIRVEADEATYNLHIMLRFEIERALLSGNLAPRDLPGAWNETFKKFLGMEVPDDRRGCLQDVHWSFGLIGYFPTYCLGNLYAAQLWETINEQIPDLDAQMSQGKFNELLTWLNENIHKHGRRYGAGELCRMVTGKALSADPLMRHLEGKLRGVYGV